MNTSKRKQKAIRLGIAAVLALVLLVSVSVVLVIANTPETEPVQADAMKVTLDGKVNLIFKFNDGKVDANTVSYTAVIGKREIDLKSEKDGENRDVVTVPLMPYEMTETVSLYHVDKDGNYLAVSTGSVRAYADEVLASPKHAAHHNKIRALLNYGAMTQIDKKANTSNLANNGLFVRNNPIDIIKEVPFGTLAKTDGDQTLKGKTSVNLVFKGGDILLRYTVNGVDSAPTATFTYNKENHSGTFVKQENGSYTFDISNVGVNNFDTVWDVTITSGKKTVTSHHSVLEYLNYLVTSTVTSTGEKITAEEKDVARSLYQLYQNTQNKLETECKHENSGYYIPADANSSYLMCAACGNKIQNAAINNNVTAYFSGAHLAAVITEFGVTPNGENGEYSYTFTNTDTNTDTGIGTLEHIWLREQYIVQTDGNPAYLGPVGGRWENTSFDIGNAQYVVIRYKWSNRAYSTGITLSLGSAAWTWENTGRIEGGQFVSNNGGVVNQGGIYSGAKFVAGDGSDYMTYVISLDKFGDKVKAADGSRIIDSMKIAIVGKTDDVLNIDYIAFVEDWTECGDIIEDSTVQLVMSTDGKTVYEMNKDGTCVNHVSTTTIVNGATSDTYSTACTVCNRPVLPENTFIDGNFLVALKSDGKNTAFNATASVGNEDGNSYYHVEATKAAEHTWFKEPFKGSDISSSTDSGLAKGVLNASHNVPGFTTVTGDKKILANNAVVSYRDYPALNVGTAKYLVIRARTNFTKPFYLYMGTVGFHDPAKKAGDQCIGVKFNIANADTWVTYVLDLEKVANYEINGEKRAPTVKDANDNDILIFDSFYLNLLVAGEMDIDYIAFVNNLSDVADITVDDSVRIMNGVTSGASTPTNTADLKNK